MEKINLNEIPNKPGIYIFKDDYDFSDYARAANIYWPGNKIGHGRDDIEKFWNNLKNTLSDIKFSIEHVGYLEEPDKNPKASIRWFLEGNHSEDTLDFGEKSLIAESM